MVPMNSVLLLPSWALLRTRFSLFITMTVNTAMKKNIKKLKIDMAWIVNSLVWMVISSCRISLKKMLSVSFSVFEC